MNACADVRIHLGGYVLAGLTAEEEREVAAHLATCAACRDELGELGDMPELLSLARVEVAAPPPELRARVLAVAGRRARRRRLLMPAAAAMLAAGLLLGLLAGIPLMGSSSPAATRVALRAGEGFDVTGVALLRPAGDGLRVDLELDGLPPLANGAIYEAWLGVPGPDGPVSIGQFSRDARGHAAVSLLASGPPERYRSIWVTAEPDATNPDHAGPTVAAAPFPEADPGPDPGPDPEGASP